MQGYTERLIGAGTVGGDNHSTIKGIEFMYNVRGFRTRARAEPGPAGELEEARSRQRLKGDLGLDEAAVEVVVGLRRQGIGLQDRVKELEAVLEINQAEYGARMSRYRQMTYEAV
jgi:hypothetical protein